MKTYAVIKGFREEELFLLTTCPMAAALGLLDAGPGYRIHEV